jgi:hypothetical protein
LLLHFPHEGPLLFHRLLKYLQKDKALKEYKENLQDIFIVFENHTNNLIEKIDLEEEIAKLRNYKYYKQQNFRKFWEDTGFLKVLVLWLLLMQKDKNHY